jgi:hypothetical protein
MNVDCESYNLSPTPTTWKKVEKMNAIWKSDQESLLFQVQSQYWLENGIITNELRSICWCIFPPPLAMKKVAHTNLEQPISADAISCPESQLLQCNHFSKTQLRWRNRKAKTQLRWRNRFSKTQLR